MHGLLPSSSSSCLLLARGVLIEIAFVAARAAAHASVHASVHASIVVLTFLKSRYCGTLLEVKDSLT